MHINFTAPDAPVTGVLVLPVAADRVLLVSGQSWDTALNGTLTRAMQNQPRFTGKKDEILSVNGFVHETITHIILLGLGDVATLKTLDYQASGAAIGSHLQAAGYTDATLDAQDLPLSEAAACLAYGMQSKIYRFDHYRTTQKPEQKTVLAMFQLVVADIAATEIAWHALDAVAQGVVFARDLVTAPPNAVYPASFVAKVEAAIAGLPLTLKTLDQQQMQDLGMNALLAVNQGSAREPYTLILEYKGLEDNSFPVALVGKGVTFDTGGLCIKPGAQPGGWPMSDMKFDMAGGAAVVGTMLALARRKAKTNVIGLVGLVENTIDAKAFLPADVVKSMSGQTIEVLNTDAEGRMVLADVLWYAQETYKPKTVIDIATLTGAILAALSDQYAGVFSDSDPLVEQLLAAGKSSGDRLWHMPLGAALEKHIDSQIADVANLGSGGAGASSAALFIKRFIQKDVAWAHIDMAGMAWTKTGTAIAPIGATGYGVSLLHEFIRQNFETA